MYYEHLPQNNEYQKGYRDGWRDAADVIDSVVLGYAERGALIESCMEELKRLPLDGATFDAAPLLELIRRCQSVVDDFHRGPQA